MNLPYSFKDIKFGVDQATYEKAVGLYENDNILDFRETSFGFAANVQGTHLYQVEVGRMDFNHGECNCYLGRKGVLCKHMIAVAIFAALGGSDIPEDDRDFVSIPVCSNLRGTLSQDDLGETRKSITYAMKYIRPYTGPSRIWFQYQMSLCEGCHRLADIVSNLPVSPQTANLLVNMIIRLNRKLVSSGVDDSDGTVGNFINNAACVLVEYAKIDPKCIQAIRKIEGISAYFDWNKPLLEIMHTHSKI